jgi:hypothetical protein
MAAGISSRARLCGGVFERNSWRFYSLDSLRFVPNISLLCLAGRRTKDRERGLSRLLRWIFPRSLQRRISPANPLPHETNPARFGLWRKQNRLPELVSLLPSSTRPGDPNGEQEEEYRCGDPQRHQERTVNSQVPPKHSKDGQENDRRHPRKSCQKFFRTHGFWFPFSPLCARTSSRR